MMDRTDATPPPSADPQAYGAPDPLDTPEAAPPPAPAPAPPPGRPPRAMLSVIAFGLALGTTTAIFAFLLGLASALFDWGTGFAAALSTVFIGYAPTFVGSVTGAVWAFAEGFVAGSLLAWLYNRYLRSSRQ